MKLSNQFFSANTYETDKNHKRALGDILSLNTSVYFNIGFMRFLQVNRKYAFQNIYDTERWALSSYEILKFIENCGGKFHITGFEHVEKVKDEPVVFISNHMGTLETMVFPCLIAPTKEVTFVVKDSLTKGTFGPIMRARNPIAVGRKDSRKDLMTVMTEGQRKLKEGTSVVIFPQSTRTEKFIINQFNSLGVKLAQKAGVKVVPMAIRTDFWGNGRLLKDLGSIHRDIPINIKFGEPLEVVGNGKETHKAVVEFIQSNLEKWGIEII